MEAIVNINGWHWLAVSAVALLASLLFWRSFFRPLMIASFLLAVMLAIVYVDIYRQLMWGAGFLVLAIVAQLLSDGKRLPPDATDRIMRRKRRLVGQRASILALQTQKQGRMQLHDAIWTVVSDQPLLLGELVEVCSTASNQVVVKPCARVSKKAMSSS